MDMQTTETRCLLAGRCEVKKNSTNPALSKRKSSNWTESLDSCTICMTWTSKERNMVCSFEARSTRVYLWKGHGVDIHTLSDQNCIDSGPDWSWGFTFPSDRSRAITMPKGVFTQWIFANSSWNATMAASGKRRTDEGLESMSCGDSSIFYLCTFR